MSEEQTSRIKNLVAQLSEDEKVKFDEDWSYVPKNYDILIRLLREDSVIYEIDNISRLYSETWKKT